MKLQFDGEKESKVDKPKKNLNKFIPILISVVLIIASLIYAHINGISNEDYLKRTSNFWIPYGLAAIGFGIIYVSVCVDSIKKKDYMCLTVHIIQGIVAVAAVVYWINLTDQMIPISQQIREFSHNENWAAANQLTQVHYDLWSKRHWLSFAVTIVEFVLNEMPSLIRKIHNRKIHKWVRKHNENRGEDQ